VGKKFKVIRITEDAYEALTYLSDATNKSRCALISELLEQLFAVANHFKKLNLEYYGRVGDGSLLIQCSGRSILQVGDFPDKGQSDEAVDKEVRQKLLRVEGERK